MTVAKTALAAGNMLDRIHSTLKFSLRHPRVSAFLGSFGASHQRAAVTSIIDALLGETHRCAA